MTNHEHEMNDQGIRVDYWRFIDKDTYDVKFDSYQESNLWTHKSSRMVWDSERREFVWENQRVPIDQVTNAVHV